MGWVRIDYSTPDKQEVHRIAEILAVDPNLVMGALLRLWIWADQQIDDGNAVSVTKALADRLGYLPGLANAMEKVGWLEETETGGFRLIGITKYIGPGAKRRAQTASRVASFRTRKSNAPSVTTNRADSNAPSVTTALPETEKSIKEPPLSPHGGNGDGSADAKKKTRTKTKTEDPADIPESLDTPEFLTAWAEWEQYRREKRQALKPTTRRKQLATLSKHPPDVAVAALEESMRQGWTGVFPEKITDGGGRRRGKGKSFIQQIMEA